MVSPGFFFIFSKFLFFWFLVRLKCKKWSKMTKNCLLCFILQEPYIIWLSLWCTCVKWWHLQAFLFFQNFDFLGCSMGNRAKNDPQLEKNVSVTLHISRTIHHMIFICGAQVWNDNISRHVFSFFKNFDFWVVRRVKGQKMAQNNKKLYLSHSISHEAYIIWLWFMVQKCKMMTSPDAFFIFSNILFYLVVSRVKGQKMTRKDKKILSHSVSQELYLIWLWFLVHVCKMMMPSTIFFILFKFLVFWVFRGVGVGGKKAKNDS